MNHRQTHTQTFFIIRMKSGKEKKKKRKKKIIRGKREMEKKDKEKVGKL